MLKALITERDHILLAGFSFFGDPFSHNDTWSEENEIGKLWKRFMSYIFGAGKEHLKRCKCDAFYEIHITHSETEKLGLFEVFVGVEVEEPFDMPEQIVLKVLPPSRYAVFTLQGQDIVADWSHEIYNEWMPTSGYKKSHDYNFQLYDSRFKGMDKIDESILDLYVPIK